ncbi:hypothetical protein ACRAWB_16250 [Leifsonia poae]
MSEADDVNHYTILMTDDGIRQILPLLEASTPTPNRHPKETPA